MRIQAAREADLHRGAGRLHGSTARRIWSGAREQRHIPPFPAEERDATGAGDCFLVGFRLGPLAWTWSLSEAARLGNFWRSARGRRPLGSCRSMRKLIAPSLPDL